MTPLVNQRVKNPNQYLEACGFSLLWSGIFDFLLFFIKLKGYYGLVAFLDPVFVYLRVPNYNNLVNLDDIIVLVKYVSLTIFFSYVYLDI